MSAALSGLRRAAGAWRVAALLLVANLVSAALLAVPLATVLEDELAHRESAAGMMYGFDYPWWAEWSETRAGWARSLGPDLLGSGFAFRNVELVARGELPLGLFRGPGADDEDRLHPLLLAVGGAYLLLHVFLSGGALSALRQRRPGFALRAFLHACGFYFGRFFRVSLLSLAFAALLFLLYQPVAAFFDDLAREAVSERAAHGWLLARLAFVLLGLATLHVVTTYARIVLVAEERTSAVLAFVSGAALFARQAARSLGVVAAMAALGVLAVALWSAFEHAWNTTGYRAQLVTFAAMQAYVFVRVLLRLSLWSGLLALYERRTGAPAE